MVIICTTTITTTTTTTTILTTIWSLLDYLCRLAKCIGTLLRHPSLTVQVGRSGIVEFPSYN